MEYKGEIQKIEMFNKALSDEEVFELYSKIVTKPYHFLGKQKKKIIKI